MSTVIRWNPIREMAAMQSAMDRIFENTWRNAQNLSANGWLALDVHETDTAYTLVTNLPGINPDAIDIKLHDGVLTMSGEVVKPEVPEGTRVLVQENVYGHFSRSVNLPQSIDVEHVEATYENGVLTLSLPKAPNAQPRQIPIKVSGLLHSEN